VEVKIGVQHAPRELVVETAQNRKDIEAAVVAALSGKSPVFSLTDDKGRVVYVSVERLSYVELGEPEVRRVGFGAD
jgi:hypothetical protein